MRIRNSLKNKSIENNSYFIAKEQRQAQDKHGKWRNEKKFTKNVTFMLTEKTNLHVDKVQTVAV